MDPTTLGFAPPDMPVREEWLSQASEEVIDPALPIIDPHHHLWYRPTQRYMAEEFLRDLQDGHDVRATVFVQGRSYYRQDGPEELRPVGETAFANAVAEGAGRALPRIAAGIVCMADLRLGDAVRPVLEAHLAAAPARLRGVRNTTAWHESVSSGQHGVSARRLLDPAFQRGFAHLAPLGLSYDVWAFHTQLDEVLALARRFPDTTIIINHAGQPLGTGPFRRQQEAVLRDWAQRVRVLSGCPNLVMKIGGFGTKRVGFDFHAGARPPSSEEVARRIKPYVETCIEAFGPARCMFESNFPVEKGSFSYRTIWNAYKRLTRSYCAGERADLFHGAAERTHRLCSATDAGGAVTGH